MSISLDELANLKLPFNNRKGNSRRNKKRIPFLQGIKVQSMTGDMVLLTDLWTESTVILKVLRRFGCPICRYEARLLSEMKPQFDKLNVKLIGVGFEEVGIQEFIDGKYWEWELFLDPDRAVHRAVGLIKMPALQGLTDLLTTASRSVINRIVQIGIPINFYGDGFQLGGTYIVGPGNTGLIYEYRQTGAAIFPSIKQIYAVVGGNPDDVDDVAPAECIFYQDSIRTKPTNSSEFETLRSRQIDPSITQFASNEINTVTCVNTNRDSILQPSSNEKNEVANRDKPTLGIAGTYIFQRNPNRPPVSKLAKIVRHESNPTTVFKFIKTSTKKKQVLFTNLPKVIYS